MGHHLALTSDGLSAAGSFSSWTAKLTRSKVPQDAPAPRANPNEARTDQRASCRRPLVALATTTGGSRSSKPLSRSLAAVILACPLVKWFNLFRVRPLASLRVLGSSSSSSRTKERSSSGALKQDTGKPERHSRARRSGNGTKNNPWEPSRWQSGLGRLVSLWPGFDAAIALPAN